jgi:hypothetical protein
MEKRTFSSPCRDKRFYDHIDYDTCPLHRLGIGSVAHVSEERTASIFRVEDMQSK